MALLNSHPDYMNLDGLKSGIEEYPERYYSDSLKYVKTRCEDQYWHVLPKEIVRFWRETMVPRKAQNG